MRLCGVVGEEVFTLMFTRWLKLKRMSLYCSLVTLRLAYNVL